MQEGGLRCDANISVMPEGAAGFGTRAEIKTLTPSALWCARSSTKSSGRSTLLKAAAMLQETRTWDDAQGMTVHAQQSRADYRYFPEPDLVPVIRRHAWIERVKNELPELPAQRQRSG